VFRCVETKKPALLWPVSPLAPCGMYPLFSGRMGDQNATPQFIAATWICCTPSNFYISEAKTACQVFVKKF
jgi:hypothetical protein